ncbi:hypothetical protein [Ensifer sp.]|uniref:hypothetical protein n=1 Tax=Ensifer sp. TaxID=1872086 RepID=UPI002E15DB8B|nr:hypothetical protein [Ensifer sp.]
MRISRGLDKSRQRLGAAEDYPWTGYGSGKHAVALNTETESEIGPDCLARQMLYQGSAPGGFIALVEQGAVIGAG